MTKIPIYIFFIYTDIVSAYTDFAVCTSEASKKMKTETSGSNSNNELYYSEVVENMAWLKKCAPIVSEPLISERDHYMALQISDFVDTFYSHSKSQNSIVVVIGAGHVSGVLAHFEKHTYKQNMFKVSIEELETVPKFVKIKLWPAFLVFLFILLCCCERCCIPRIRRCLKSEEKFGENSDSESGGNNEERYRMVDTPNDSVKEDESSSSESINSAISGSIAGATASVNADHNMNMNDLPQPPPNGEN